MTNYEACKALGINEMSRLLARLDLDKLGDSYCKNGCRHANESGCKFQDCVTDEEVVKWWLAQEADE